MTVSRPQNPVLTIMIRNLEWKALALCLAKTKEREEKGKGGREGRGKDSDFPFTCLVCKGELEGNIPYWWVIQTKQVKGK